MANSKSIGVAYEDPALSGGTIDNTPIGSTTRSTVKATTLQVSGTTTISGPLHVTGATVFSSSVGIGTSAGHQVGFHGAAGTSQASFVATISFVFIEGSVSASALVGFSRGQVSNMTTLLNALQALLVAKGLMASA